MKAITNAQVITLSGILRKHTVLFTDRILSIMPDLGIDIQDCSELINADGRYLSPGFIDVHIHGCAGVDTMDGTVTVLKKMQLKLAETGVTTFLPTTMTMPLARIENVLECIRAVKQKGSGAQILGCHLEGPFISKSYKGAQASEYIIEPDYVKIAQYADVIKIATIAPELAGSLEFIQACVKNNIVASIGHSAATYEEGMAAIKAGASHVTHTFNAFAPFNHRQPGMVGVLNDCSQVTCELIADNIHVHPVVQRILLKIKNIDTLILVTDAMRACLVGEGEFELGGQKVFVKNGEARLQSGTIAGSILTLNQAVANFRSTSGLSIAEVIKTVTINPAKRLGIDNQKGSIAIGKDADLVIFDENLKVFTTYGQGKRIFGGCANEDSNC